MNLNEKLNQLEQHLAKVEAQLTQVTNELVQIKHPTPISVHSGKPMHNSAVVDRSTKLGNTLGGTIIWNDAELQFLSSTSQMAAITPTKGYHRHSHSRYSGGALDVTNLELVEYEENEALPPDSQSYWNGQEKIATETKKTRTYTTVPTPQGDQETFSVNRTDVPKLGPLALIFNPNAAQWGVASYEIDVKGCYLVERDENGEIELDEDNNEKSSPLWNEDTTKTSVVWDKNAKCWRFYAAFAPTPEDPPTPNPGATE